MGKNVNRILHDCQVRKCLVDQNIHYGIDGIVIPCVNWSKSQAMEVMEPKALDSYINDDLADIVQNMCIGDGRTIGIRGFPFSDETMLCTLDSCNSISAHESGRGRNRPQRSPPKESIDPQEIAGSGPNLSTDMGSPMCVTSTTGDNCKKHIPGKCSIISNAADKEDKITKAKVFTKTSVIDQNSPGCTNNAKRLTKPDLPRKPYWIAANGPEPADELKQQSQAYVSRVQPPESLTQTSTKVTKPTVPKKPTKLNVPNPPFRLVAQPTKPEQPYLGFGDEEQQRCDIATSSTKLEPEAKKLDKLAELRDANGPSHTFFCWWNQPEVKPQADEPESTNLTDIQKALRESPTLSTVEDCDSICALHRFLDSERKLDSPQSCSSSSGSCDSDVGISLDGLPEPRLSSDLVQSEEGATTASDQSRLRRSPIEAEIPVQVVPTVKIPAYITHEARENDSTDHADASLELGYPMRVLLGDSKDDPTDEVCDVGFPTRDVVSDWFGQADLLNPTKPGSLATPLETKADKVKPQNGVNGWDRLTRPLSLGRGNFIQPEEETFHGSESWFIYGPKDSSKGKPSLKKKQRNQKSKTGKGRACNSTAARQHTEHDLSENGVSETRNAPNDFRQRFLLAVGDDLKDESSDPDESVRTTAATSVPRYIAQYQQDFGRRKEIKKVPKPEAPQIPRVNHVVNSGWDMPDSTSLRLGSIRRFFAAKGQEATADQQNVDDLSDSENHRGFSGWDMPDSTSPRLSSIRRFFAGDRQVATADQQNVDDLSDSENRRGFRGWHATGQPSVANGSRRKATQSSRMQNPSEYRDDNFHVFQCPSETERWADDPGPRRNVQRCSAYNPCEDLQTDDLDVYDTASEQFSDCDLYDMHDNRFSQQDSFVRNHLHDSYNEDLKMALRLQEETDAKLAEEMQMSEIMEDEVRSRPRSRRPQDEYSPIQSFFQGPRNRGAGQSFFQAPRYTGAGHQGFGRTWLGQQRNQIGPFGHQAANGCDVLPRDWFEPDGFDPNNFEAVLALTEEVGSASEAGMSSQAINSLPMQVLTPAGLQQLQATDDLQCKVCWDDYELQDKLRILPCMHRYHSACIDQWLMTNSSCPVCRKSTKVAFM